MSLFWGLRGTERIVIEYTISRIAKDCDDIARVSDLGSQSDVNYETIGKFLRILVQSFRLPGNPFLFSNPVAIQLDFADCGQSWQSRSLPDLICSIAKSGQS